MNDVKRSSFAPTIVLDASSLMHLFAPISREHLALCAGKPIRRYFDILDRLTEQGFEIVIPDIVCYEAGAILSNGKDLDTFFPKKTQNPQIESSYNLKGLKEVLMDISAGHPKYKGFRIEKVSRPESTVVALKELNTITEIFAPGPNGNAAIQPHQQAIKQSPRPEGIAALVCTYPTDKELFLLSDSFTLHKINTDFSRLSTSGLIHAVVNSGWSESLGLDPEITAQDLCTGNHNLRNTINNETLYQPVDCSKISGPNDYPFLNRLKVLLDRPEPQLNGQENLATTTGVTKTSTPYTGRH